MSNQLSKMVTAKSEKEAIEKAIFKLKDFGLNMNVWPLKKVVCMSDGKTDLSYLKPVNKNFIVYFGGI